MGRCSKIPRQPGDRNMTHRGWKISENRKPIICIDFHHTITKNCEACPDFSGEYELQEGAKEVIEELSKNFEIVIYTGNPKGLHWLPLNYKEKIIKFLFDNDIHYDRFLATKPPACFLVDDRAITHKSWTNTMIEIKNRMGKW